MGARVIHLSLEPDTYGLSVDGLLGAVTDRCKIVCVCTPNNPTRLLIDAASMERLVRELPKDVLLVVDEAYFEYVTDERDVYKRQVRNRRKACLHRFRRMKM